MLNKAPRFLTTFKVGILIPALQIKNLKHKDIEGSAQGNLVGKSWIQDSNPDPPGSRYIHKAAVHTHYVTWEVKSIVISAMNRSANKCETATY